MMESMNLTEGGSLSGGPLARPIRLLGLGAGRIEHVHVRQRHEAGGAELDLHAEHESAEGLALTATLHAPGGDAAPEASAELDAHGRGACHLRCARSRPGHAPLAGHRRGGARYGKGNVS